MSGRLRDEVVVAGRSLEAAQHRLVGLVAALDRSGEWALDGAATCAHWIAAALDVEVCTAREWLRVGRALESLETVDRAFREGKLSYSKVRALTRVANAVSQAELCELAQQVPAGRLSTVLAGWLTRHEMPEETERRQWAARSLRWRVEPDGMVVGTFRLAPADAAVVMSAVDASAAQRGPAALAVPVSRADGGLGASAGVPETRTVAVWPSVAQQRADALVDLVSGGGAGVTTEVVLHVRADGCSLDNGTPVAGSVVERIAPDAFLRALIHDAQARPVNASGRRRHPSVRQRRVVRERDRVCVDCGATEHLEYDHEPDFELTGRTVVDELRLRCRTCHRARHGAAEDAA